MSINTPLGDTLDGTLQQMIAGASAVSAWKTFDTSNIYCKVGGDLADYDVTRKIASFGGRVPPELVRRLQRLASRAPWSTRLSMLLALDGYLHAGLFDAGVDPARIAVIVAGHNINLNYAYQNCRQFAEEPDFVDSLMTLYELDTDHAGSISELLGILGPIYTVGGACASGNNALRCAVDEIRHHDIDVVLVVGAILDFSPVYLHALALMGAISFQSYNDTPERASRPFDTHREGFVPAHGGAVLVLERLGHALGRRARIHAEVLNVEANANGNHLPEPSELGQARLMTRLLDMCDLHPEDIDYISAHATSTPLGDLSEVRAIQQVFGEHAGRLCINAPKSLLGHTCWAAPVVETVVGILQMEAGVLHPSINIDELDPAIDLDVCRGSVVRRDIRIWMKNSFGFSGINCCSILRRFEG